MPAGFRRHLVGWNTLCWQASDHTIIFVNQRIECYLNSTINLRPLTPHVMPCYTHKMASKASWHRNYVTVILCLVFRRVQWPLLPLTAWSTFVIIVGLPAVVRIHANFAPMSTVKKRLGNINFCITSPPGLHKAQTKAGLCSAFVSY